MMGRGQTPPSVRENQELLSRTEGGVCGTAAAARETVLVEDVHAFPGHIACDMASRSELVVPILKDGRVLGVLDLDSPLPARFDAEDRAGCERLVETLLKSLG